jgi:hypothetical protein
MKKLLPDLLARIEQHQLKGLDLGPDSIYPFYSGLSLANIPDSICRWLGVPDFAEQPFVSEILDQFPQQFKHVILLVVDGMGLNTLQAVLEQAEHQSEYEIWREIMDEGVLAPLTSIVPSTTSSALTTFWTGRPPAEHGVVGYEVWLKEYGVIANMILHSPASFYRDVGSLRKAGFDPETFLPVQTIGPHLARQGVRSYAFQHASIAHSGLSTMLFAGADIFPFRSLGDLWVTLNNLMEKRPDERSYMYIYWGDLDEHSHRFGPDDERVSLEFSSFSRQLSKFLSKRRALAHQDTLLLITADHGHISTPRQASYELRNHPELLKCLTMSPSGEARLPFVFLRCGREKQFLQYVEETWNGQFRAIPSEQAVCAGLFGPITNERLLDRVGDYVIIPQENAYWWFSSRDNPLLGRHGGVSRTEMLVPLLGIII